MSMLPKGWLVALCVVLMGAGACRAEDAFDLRPAPEFLKLPESWTLGACSAVAFNRRGELLLLHRGKTTVDGLRRPGGIPAVVGRRCDPRPPRSAG